MAITRDDVLGVARLARLSLGADEADHLVADLDHILDAFRTLGQLDTSGVEPMRPIDDDLADLRSDQVENPPADDALLAGAPDRHDRLFHVPKIIE